MNSAPYQTLQGAAPRLCMQIGLQCGSALLTTNAFLESKPARSTSVRARELKLVWAQGRMSFLAFTGRQKVRNRFIAGEKTLCSPFCSPRHLISEWRSRTALEYRNTQPRFGVESEDAEGQDCLLLWAVLCGPSCSHTLHKSPPCEQVERQRRSHTRAVLLLPST